MSRKTSGKVLLSAKESVPPPGYSGRQNIGYESNQDFEQINGINRREGGLKTQYSHEAQHNYHERRPSTFVKDMEIESICLCTASVYPHYHAETLIDGDVYDEVLVLDPKELQHTANKRIHLRGQCLRICKLFAIVVIVLAGLACGLYGVSHYFIVNKGSQAPMMNGDAKLLQYSTYFCERIKTETSDVARSMTVIKKKIGRAASFNYNMTKELQLESDKGFYEQTFYAITQGVLEITIKTIEDVDIIIFDEKYRADAWKSNKNYAGYRFKRTCCKSVTTERGVYEFRTKQDREVILVIYSSVKTNASLTMTVRRTFNDYEKDDETCFANEKDACSVPLSFGSDDKVVIEIPRSSQIAVSKKVEWTCQARVWFYVLVFAGIFLALIIVICICYCILKYCFCDPCCCCFCCYIVPKEKDKNKIVQYHRGTSTLMRTPRGPRANDIRAIEIRKSDELINHGYTTSDTSDTESRVITKPTHIRRTNSEVTTQSDISIDYSRRRSSSIGSDIKSGMYVDDSYEELPYNDEVISDGNVIIKTVGDEADGYRSTREKRNNKTKETRRKTYRQNHENNDGYLADIETRLQKKKTQFSDSEEDKGSESDDYDNTYDVVGFELTGPSKSTAETIDSLPLGPSGAPPRAPPKSAASLKGKPGLRGKKSLVQTDILPNGMTRVRTEGLQKSKSDAAQKIRKRSCPITPQVVVVVPNNERKRSEGYRGYDRDMKRQNDAKGVYNRTISLDSGLDSIDGRQHTRIRPAADVKF